MRIAYNLSIIRISNILDSGSEVYNDDDDDDDDDDDRDVKYKKKQQGGRTLRTYKTRSC